MVCLFDILICWVVIQWLLLCSRLVIIGLIFLGMFICFSVVMVVNCVFIFVLFCISLLLKLVVIVLGVMVLMVMLCLFSLWVMYMFSIFIVVLVVVQVEKSGQEMWVSLDEKLMICLLFVSSGSRVCMRKNIFLMWMLNSLLNCVLCVLVSGVNLLCFVLLIRWLKVVCFQMLVSVLLRLLVKVGKLVVCVIFSGRVMVLWFRVWMLVIIVFVCLRLLWQVMMIFLFWWVIFSVV